MIKLPKEKNNLVMDLFDNPTSTIVLSCLQGYLGEIWVDNLLKPGMALMYAGSTFYIAGCECNENVILWMKTLIEERNIVQIEIIPQDDFGAKFFEAFTEDGSDFQLKKTYRHLMKITDMKEKQELWMDCVNRSWDQVTLCEINEELFVAASTDRYLSNFVCNFKTYEEFNRLGLGYFLLHNDEIIGGVSSFTRYDKGIEVQIAIAPAYRKMGLAKACAARLLIESYNKGLYPNWDAANPASENLAKSLGYELQKENVVYKYTHQ